MKTDGGGTQKRTERERRGEKLETGIANAPIVQGVCDYFSPLLKSLSLSLLVVYTYIYITIFPIRDLKLVETCIKKSILVSVNFILQKG